MRILICKVPSIHVSREGVTGEGALQAVARVLLEAVNLPGTQRALAGMGKVLSAAPTLLPARIDISVSKQLTV